MEHLDYLPFLQFIRDDKETVEIMQKALTIIPKVCDFLDGNLEAFNPRSGGSGLSSSLTPGMMPPLLLPPTTGENRLTPTPETSRASLPRKRKQSIRDATSESTSVAHANPSTSVAQVNPSTSGGLPIPKKARVLNPPMTDIQVRPPARSQSRPTHESRDLPTLTQIRERLQDDYDKFVRQIGELAALEREKNRLLGKFLSVSAIASGSATSESSSTSDTSTSDD